MTNQVQITLEHDVLDEPCPRCGSNAVRLVVYASTREVVPEQTDAAAEALRASDPLPAPDPRFDSEALFDSDPLFDCVECGFEWGELVRDLMR